MPTRDVESILVERFRHAMRAALGDALPVGADPLIAASRNPSFGDFQSNAAMPLAKALGRPPRQIAQSIVDRLELDDLAEPPTVAGPGFINVRLKAEALAGLLAAMDEPGLGVEPPAEPDTVVVDLCGVNLAKQMHVGHLRATVIGDALARLFERLGHRVVRQNHFGDWGLPIAMVTAYVRRLVDRGEADLERLTLDDLDRYYRAAQAECDADRPGLEAARRFGLGPKALAELEAQVAGAEERLADAKRALVALQSGDESILTIWRRIADVTLTECLATCARLGANVTAEHTAGESTYRDELPEIVEDLLARGVARESRGAVIIDLTDMGIAEPLLIRKSDGGFLYATTDLAGIRRRVRDMGGTRLVYAVDARQSLHFRQVFAGAIKAGYAQTAAGADARLEHAAFGTVLGEDGRPFKTRSGENVRLSDLLDEAVRRAGDAVAQKNPDLPEGERAAVAEAVGIGAVKFADLATDRIKDYVFSFDRMLAFEGDTGPYLQYALVRVRSILRKAQEELGVEPASLTGPDAPPIVITEPDERALALALLRFGSTLAGAAESLQPHRLCAYLLSLASAFSGFFQTCPVLRAPDEAARRSRLRLTALTGAVLTAGLETLGVTPLDRM
ncbi:MAG: arginine--tRNA ligase [Planctomycetota bacterium]|nr:MAG: arginine--tRNA ligase [Planctomycetota bacterium]